MIKHYKRLLGILTILFSLGVYYNNCYGLDILKIISKMSGKGTDANVAVTADEDKDEESENGEFNFIKTSGDVRENFFSSDKLLLYGGIILVSTSILGMIFTFVPIRKRVNKKIKRIQNVKK